MFIYFVVAAILMEDNSAFRQNVESRQIPERIYKELDLPNGHSKYTDIPTP